MMARAKKKQNLNLEDLLEQALVPEDEQPYKVPDNWVWVKLGSAVSIKRGASPRPIKAYITEDENGVNWIKIGDTGEGKYVYSVKEKITQEGARKSVYVEKGTLILSNSMSFGRPYILEVDGCIHDGWLAITVSDCFHKEYMYYALLASEWYFEQVAVGTAVRNLNSERVANLPVPLPPIIEQQRIVNSIENLFAKLEQAKELVQSALDKFETRKAAILRKAFTGELTVNWREKHGVGMESWEDVTIKDVCIINPKRTDVSGYSDDTLVTFIPMSAVSEVTGTIVEPLLKPLAEVRKGYTNFCENDVLFAKITPCMENGKSAIVGKLENGIGFGSTEFHVIRCSERINNQFIYYLLRSSKFRNEAKSVMTGAVGQQRVPKDFLENYPLSLPPIEEQLEIVRILNRVFDMDNKVIELISVLEQIDLIKKSILSRAFRGELGTNDETDEPAARLLMKVLEKHSNYK